jgi:hypothetical protein
MKNKQTSYLTLMEFDFEYQQQHNIHRAITKYLKKNFYIEILTLAPEINRVFKSIGLPT